VNGVPEHLVPHGTRLYPIYVTSPVKQPWSRLEKTTSPLVAVMNPWTRWNSLCVSYSLYTIAMLTVPQCAVEDVKE
jgi:hypothetical protein